MFIKVFCILAVLAFASGKTISRKQVGGGRIVGGENTTIEENPWQVSLQYSGFHYCGGSVIAPDVILTAAHCAEIMIPGLDVVVAGSDKLSEPGQQVGIKEVIIHENFSYFTLDYDVGLLITEPLELNDKVQPATLPQQGDELEVGTNVKITGWGNTMSDAEFPDNLQTVTVPIVDSQECNEELADITPITDRMICAGVSEGGKDSCQGDSGGPLVAGDTLQGIVSWGVGCAAPGKPGVYTKISSVRDWIKDNSGV